MCNDVYFSFLTPLIETKVQENVSTLSLSSMLLKRFVPEILKTNGNPNCSSNTIKQSF